MLAGDATAAVLGAYGVAVLNLLLAVVVSHVRVNDYDSRYLTLTNLFGPISGMLVLFLLATTLTAALGMSRVVRPAFLAIGAVLLALNFPAPQRNVNYEVLHTSALELAQRAPRGVLIGGYWDIYALVALQPEAAMTPVALEGEFSRTPWTGEVVRQTDRVIVGRSQKATRSNPLPHVLRQDGCTLRLVNPYWYGNNEWVFAQYANESCERR
jgi:hypothetical protein